MKKKRGKSQHKPPAQEPSYAFMLSTAKWKKTLIPAQARVREEPLWLEDTPLLQE
jgi:hypothetical protein